MSSYSIFPERLVYLARALRSVARSSFWPLVVRVAGTVTAFVLSVFLARTLGLAEFGTYSLVLSTIAMMSIPIQSGIPTLATRETSKAITRGERNAIGSFLRWSTRLIVTYSSGVAVLTLIAHLVLRDSLFVENLAIAIVSVGTLSLTQRNSAVLRGLGRFVEGFSPDTLVRPLVQLSVLGMLWGFALQKVLLARLALTAFVIASVVALLASSFWLKSRFSAYGEISKKMMPAPTEWRKGVFFLTIAGGGQVVFGHLDTLMLGALSDSADVGAYRAALQISMLLIFVLTVVNQVLQPMLARLYQLKDIAGLQELAAESSLLMFFAALVPGLGLVLFAGPLLDLVYGESYLTARTALQILAIGQVMNVFFGSVGTILNMTGMERESVTAVVIATVLNILLDVALIPELGVTGAALASAISIFVWNAICRHYVKTRVGIESSGVIHKVRRALS